MASQTEIINRAIYKLKDARISGPDDTGSTAIIMTEVFSTVRDATLREHPWNFAVHRASLAAGAATPEFDWAYQYALPNSPYCLRLLQVGPKDEPIGHEVEGRKILTDGGAPLKIRFIKRVTDPDEFDASFVEALAARLAHETAGSIADTSQIQIDKLWDRYQDLLPVARSMDALEGTPRAFFRSKLLASRQ